MKFAFVPLLLLLLLVGCGPDVRTTSMTGGVRVEMLHEGEGNLAEYYRVDRDGTLHFAGGREAILRKVSWTDSMSPEEIDGLTAILNEERLFTHKPASTGEPRQVRTELAVVGPPGRQTVRVRGTCDAADRVRAYLGEIATRRFESFMRTLPQPNVSSDEATNDSDDD